jgi:hypothetical protein
MWRALSAERPRRSLTIQHVPPKLMVKLSISGVFMKTRFIRASLVAGFGAALLAASSVTAQTETNAAAAPAAMPAQTTKVRLPYGVEDVLKLNRAQVSEDITLNFIQNSGISYNLAPDDIVYLHNQGVSDRLINAMLDERKRVMAQAAAAQPAAPAPTSPAPAPTYVDSSAAAPAYAPAPQPEVQPQVQVQAPPSTVYVIPYSTTYPYYGYPYYYSSPYYYYGGYYWGPSVSLGFRFGGGGHFGGGSHFGGGYHHR